MDRRFEAMDKRFENLTKEMDRRFEEQNEKMEKNFTELRNILGNLMKVFGAPFEQFARNVVIRILDAEGMKNGQLKQKVIKNPEKIDFEHEEVDLDGFSIEPPVAVEIISILRNEEKINKFINKIHFLNTKYGTKFRGFFVAAGTEFSQDQIAKAIITLKKENIEYINL